ncbi:MAG: Gfo/Idh/MocA family protein [Panacagrimonas sp.]
MVRVGVVGLGKMGLSHQSMINAHPEVTLAAVCDPTSYVLDVLGKYTGVKTWSDYDRMLAEAELDAVLIATPSHLHAPMVSAALERGVHVFCEKPFVLDSVEGERLVALARERGLVNQVGYHNRFVGAFQEVKRLLDARAIGEVSHVTAEAYGPVTLRTKEGSWWRNQRSEGGGCLYDYAAHPINLMNWYFGQPKAVGGTVLGHIFSRETEDEVYSTLYFDGGLSGRLSVNWSDESYRKMSTKISIWGTCGRIYADRQECQVYLRDTAAIPDGYRAGWNVRYTTELTQPVWFYVRGEEYSAQLDYFIDCIVQGRRDNVNSFDSALATDQVIDMLIADGKDGPKIPATRAVTETVAKPEKRRFVLW